MSWVETLTIRTAMVTELAVSSREPLMRQPIFGWRTPPRVALDEMYLRVAMVGARTLSIAKSQKSCPLPLVVGSPRVHVDAHVS